MILGRKIESMENQELRCLHCLNGHKPEYQQRTGEWVHRNSRVLATNKQTGRVMSRGFSITICIDRPGRG